MSSTKGGLPFPQAGASSSQIPSVSKTVVPLTILCALALVTYVLRIYTRLRPIPRLQWDDHAMTVAILFTLAYYFANIASTTIAAAKLSQGLDFTAIEQILLLTFLIRLLWIWSVTMIKVSVTLMILRIKQERNWQRGLICLNGVLLFSAIGNSISIILSCRPVEGNWKIMLALKPGVCQSQELTLRLIWASTVLFALTDIICALLPLAFITRIQRPLREKIILAILMGLGIIAAACGITRSVLYSMTLYSESTAQSDVAIAVLAFGELAIGVIAANIPCLKSYLQKAFTTLGGHISTKKSSKLLTYGTNPTGTTTASSRFAYSQLNSVELGKLSNGQSVIATKDLEANNTDLTSRDTDEATILELEYPKPTRI